MRDLIGRHGRVTYENNFVVMLVAVEDIERVDSLIHPALVFFPNTVVDKVMEVIRL